MRRLAVLILLALFAALPVWRSAAAVPTPSAPAAPAPQAQLSAPASIRVKHDARNGCRQVPVDQIDVVAFEEYVKRVVPHESPASWPAESLKAQAVAARTYGWYRIATRSAYTWDVSDYADTQMMCDDRYASTDAAVDATSGQHLLYNGQIILAQFSADNGNPTLTFSGVPYLLGVEDPVSFGKARNGHGHGLSQWGAYRWATRFNWDYQKMLMHYYSNVRLELPAAATPDTTPPMAAVVDPWHGWYLTGSKALVRANASDGYSGVSNVSFSARLAGGATVNIGNAGATPGGWTAAWDLAAVPEQAANALTLNVAARDAAGNVLSSGVTTILGIDRLPPTMTAALAAPYNGGDSVSLSLAAGDSGSGLAGMSLSNNWLWEGEDLARFTGNTVSDAGALNGSAWLARAGVDPVGNTYGPWATGLPGGKQYRAYFRLKTTGVLSTTAIANLEVITSTNGVATVLGYHQVRGGDFRAAGQYQEFAVEFDYPRAGEQVELRAFFLGVADVYLDRVLVVSYPEPFAASKTWPLSPGANPRTVQVKAIDAAGNVSPDAVVVVGGSSTPTPTATVVHVPTVTATASATPSQAATSSPTPVPTVSVTPSASATASGVPSPTWTATLPATPSASITATATPSATPPATATPSAAATATATATATITATTTPAPPVLRVSPAALYILAAPDLPPLALTLTIANSGEAALTWSASETAGWLGIAPNRGDALPGRPSQLAATVSLAGLSYGWYSAQIVVNSYTPGVEGSPQRVPVYLSYQPTLYRMYLPVQVAGVEEP